MSGKVALLNKKIKREWINQQESIGKRVILKDDFKKIKYIGACDVSFNKSNGYCACVVFAYPFLKLLDYSVIKTKVTIPYIPGFLSFREKQPILQAYKKLKIKPDLILLDGQGIAHPRKAGLASTIGVILNKPTIGCAKSSFVGEYSSPESKKGSASPLFYNKRVVGYAIRTRDNTRPVFVSPGHRVSLEKSKAIVLSLCDKYRIPEPLRYAHILSKMKPQDFPGMAQKLISGLKL